MLPLLGDRLQAINANDNVNKRRKISFDQGFDRFTFIINVIRHMYNIFLMYYYWDKGNDIGQALLIIYCCLGIFVGLAGYGIAYEIHGRRLAGCEKLIFYTGMSIILVIQPLFISFIFIYHLEEFKREYFYGTIFVNLLFNAIPSATALFYYLVSHPAQYFSPSNLDQFIMLIYLILFALSIVSVYPLFMPLNSINTRHLLFKLCTVLINIIRMLFVGFLLISYQWSIISVHPTVEYIYDCYLIQLFEITPIFCIWIIFYTMNFHYFDAINEMIAYLMRFNLIKSIFCGLCYIVFIIFAAILGIPAFILICYILAGVYWWIIYQCFVFNIIDSFIFVDAVDLVQNEMKHGKQFISI